MAHELTGALQQAGRIRQRCALKEPHVYVRSEYIDVAEGSISQTCNRIAVMQELPNFVPAFSHHRQRARAEKGQAIYHPECFEEHGRTRKLIDWRRRSRSKSPIDENHLNQQVCTHTEADDLWD